MSWTLMNDQIKVILETVSGIGLVHKYQRVAVNWAKVLELFKDSSDRINGCMITRVNRKTHALAMGGENIRSQHFVIRMFYAVSDTDESELTFQLLVDAVCDALAANETLNGTCLAISDIGAGESPAGITGPQAEVIEPRFFANILCHYAEIHIYAKEQC